MLLPIEWLKQFVTVDESPELVAERFIELGFEAELKDDQILDLEITPNRGDCLSILGLAREYAASTGQTVKMPEVVAIKSGPDQSIPMTINGDPKAYHQLSAVVVKNITVTQSPAWLKEAVESVGMNSINTIVDLTNYVMFELGIPMHAFDYDQLSKHEVQIRLSEEGEKFMSLKDEAIDLPVNSIVVESDAKIIDLLGIRGGKSTMITDQTTNIFVWAVSVPRPLIRNTVKKTGLRTEGAYRHERETDWAMTTTAVARFVKLLEKVGGGEASDIVSVNPAMKEQPKKQINFNPDHVNQLLGTEYPTDEVIAALKALGFKVDANSVTVPSWRYFDINFEEDLIEEVARIQGYTKLPHKVIETTPAVTATKFAKIENLRDQLASAGLVEVYTESFSGREDGKILGWQEDQLATLANPVNRDFAYCRPAITPNLVKLLGLNSWSDDAKIFEIGNVFPNTDSEETRLALAAYGNQTKLFEQWVPAESIQLITPDQSLAKRYTIRRPITVAEVALNDIKIALESVFAIPAIRPSYHSVSSFPPAVRDISLISDTTTDPATIINYIKNTAPERIILVELFDQFQSDKFGPNKQSLAFHIVYQDLNKTLAAAEVDTLHATILEGLKSQFGAVIR